MVIVGLNAYHADASAAIFVDGELIAAIEEERFTRIKHWAGFPAQSLNFCLETAGIKINEVDHFAVGRNPGAKLLSKMLYASADPFIALTAVKERVGNSKKILSLGQQLRSFSGSASLIKSVKKVEHHRSHISSAFYASGFDNAACLSVDGSGDFSTTMAATGNDQLLDIITSVNFPHSLGIFYTAFTQLLGFPHYGDEYKVMGMASYGDPKYVDQLHDVIKLKKNGLFALNLAYFRKGTSGILTYTDHAPVVQPLYSAVMIKKFGKVRLPDEPLNQYHRDLAASVQKMTEIVLFHMLNALHKETKIDNLCLAGGVAQNSVANGKITDNTPFTDVYIPVAAHDAGISIGAALYVQHKILRMPRTAASYDPYLGSSFTQAEVRVAAQESWLKFEELDEEELFEVVAEALSTGAVVGWFRGRAEFGPRALGGRSILADPRSADARERINKKIKRRENFRPFAPAILKEMAVEFFEGGSSPFMEKVSTVRPEKRALIPAVTHVDGSARVQTVDKKINAPFYKLIERFYQKTGVPVLLNTSFNENEPIVNTPQEAIACYKRTEMDMLVIENIVFRRSPAL